MVVSNKFSWVRTISGGGGTCQGPAQGTLMLSQVEHSEDERLRWHNTSSSRWMTEMTLSSYYYLLDYYYSIAML
jgi:hypothetical protein